MGIRGGAVPRPPGLLGTGGCAVPRTPPMLRGAVPRPEFPAPEWGLGPQAKVILFLGVNIAKAYVVPARADADETALGAELQAFVKGRIAPYKYPRDVAFLAELPRTETGKVQRYKLRQLAASEDG